MKKITDKNILATLVLLITATLLYSQEEAPYKGGSGDGFAIGNSALINMSEVNYEGSPLLVTVEQAQNQSDTTNTEPIVFTVSFSESVLDFEENDISIYGTPSPDITIYGSGTDYVIEVRNIEANGEISAFVSEGTVHNSSGRPNVESTSTDNIVVYSGADLNVEITLFEGQKPLTNKKEVSFYIKFSDEVINFSSEDIEISGTATPAQVSISGSGDLYIATVSEISNEGNIQINLPANRVHNTYGTPNNNSLNTENSVITDYTPPLVEITQEEGQEDPAYAEPLRFHLKFSEKILKMDDNFISYGASSGVYIDIRNMENEYTVNVYGAKHGETIMIFIDEGVIQDLAGNFNLPSVNIDNSITFLGTTSIDEINKNADYSIYYAKGNIVVENISEAKKNAYIYIYDIYGKSVYYNIDLRKRKIFPVFNSNIYIVKIVDNEKIFSKIILSK